VLFVPREVVKLLFLASGITAGLIRDEQVVPRLDEMLSPPPGSYSVLPSIFADSRRRVSIGAQLIGNSRWAAMRLSSGFGGIHDLVGEVRLRAALPRPLPFVLSIEGFADSRSTLDYLGVGQDPATDPRNHFRKGAATEDALYFEERERAIFTLGARFGPDVEAFLSSSVVRSHIEDTPGGGSASISNVFQPGTLPGAPSLTPGACPAADASLIGPPPGNPSAFLASSCPSESRISYTELAVRFDTRASKSQPSPGVLVELYTGAALGVAGDPSRLYRVGGRAAGFISILRKTNILSPKIIVDATARPSSVPLESFTLLDGQPDFRGFDSRVDYVSLVASIDYRWSMIRWLGPRIFLDMATVGPDPGALFKVPPRFAGGFGFDLFSTSTELAQAMMSFSNEGVRVLFTFGIPTQFGDRQHRR
jgi:hypothetical protein